MWHLCGTGGIAQDPKNPQTLIKYGAGSRIRTDDRLITNQVLYQLSYTGDSWMRVPCRGVFGKQDGVNREMMNQSQERLYAI